MGETLCASLETSMTKIRETHKQVMGLAYEDLGQKSRARAEFEKFYAETPGFEDVAERLGL